MILDIPEGRFMVVSDLHGHASDFDLVINRWKHHQAAGETDGIVFLGDLVHGRGKWPDASPHFIDTLLDLGCNQPGSNVHALLGNHELVHIYHAELWSSTYCYTEEFERAIAHDREHYITFLESMPFAIRTGGGVLLNHTGGSGYLAGLPLGPYQPDFETLSQWDHREALVHIGNLSGRQILPETVQRKFKPDLAMTFRPSPEGNFLWEMLMNKNERIYGDAYADVLRHTLSFLSHGHPTGLNMVVSGHIRVPLGWQVVNPQQLRLSTTYGASEDANKTYVIVDASRRYQDAAELASERLQLCS